MGFSFHRAAAATGQEIQIAAAVGLCHVLDVELVVAARVLGRRSISLPGPGARGKFFRRDQQFDTARRTVEQNLVPIAHHGQRSAGLRFRSDVQHHGAESGAAHAGIGDAQHVAYALLEQLARQRHVAHFRHAGVTLGSATLEHQHRAGVDFELRIVDACPQILDGFEHHGTASMLEQRRTGGARLHDGAIGTKVAVQYPDAGCCIDRIGHRPDDLAIETFCRRDDFTQG